MPDTDPYEVLGLDPGASPEQIRQAFRRAVRRDHPDTSTGSDGGAAVRDVILAYRALVELRGSASRDPTTAESPARDRAGGRRITVRRTPDGQASSRFTYGSQVCSSCSGSGSVWIHAACRGCGGHGVVTLLDVRRVRTLRCDSCRGRGRQRLVAHCPICGGTGTEP